MTDITVRPARLDDAGAISALFRARISVWQRIDPQGRVESLPYDSLSIYDRWTHGGPWMSIETGAVLLSRLLRGVGVALVALDGARVVGYAEAYPGDEPPPYGPHLHLAHLVADADDPDAICDALMERLIAIAGGSPGRRLTVSTAGAGDPMAALVARYGFVPLASVGRYTLPARAGQSFYKALDHAGAGVDQIAGWQMSIGRAESAAQHWEALWPRLWDIIPEVAARGAHRLHLSASGHEAFVWFQGMIHNPRAADIACWSPKPLGAPLLTAIRDWAYRQGYRTLGMIVSPETAKILGGEAEPEPYTRQIYALTPER
jgi:hypothetical protein